MTPPHPRARVLAAAVTALLAGCGADRTARTATIAPVAPLSEAELNQLVITLGREASGIRGLSLDRAVPVHVESSAQITAHLREELLANRRELLEEGRIGVALGVLPAGIDIVDVVSRFIGAEAQGYYDPDTARLVLTDTEARALRSAGPDGLDARATIVHELTHALQHQHFAARVEEQQTRSPSMSDDARARMALLEGDATLTAMEWSARRRGGRMLDTPELQSRVARWAEGAQILTEVDVPSYLLESAEAPYETGTIAIAALHAAGGWRRVDAALQNEALRSSQLLHPDRPESAAAYTVVPPPAGESFVARALARTVTRSLGEIELRLYLGRVMRTPRAAALAAAWRGDSMALFESPAGDLAVIWDIGCVDEQGARAIAGGLAPLADRWRREGCPGVLGGAHPPCPASIAVDGAHVVVTRGG